MRNQDGPPAGLRIKALDDLLPEAVVGPALWRRTVNIAAPIIANGRRRRS
jgi:hypothetical protein